MKEYHAQSIRNIAVMGHLGSGKTSLTEALLYVSGAIEKKGDIERKNTVSDYTFEEQTKQITLSTSLIPVERREHKINFLDTPGNEEFVGEINSVLSVVEAAVLVVDASKGIEVGTERCWEELKARGIPTMIFINKVDKENIKYESIVSSLRENLSKHILPLACPLGLGEELKGIALVAGDNSKEDIKPDTKNKLEELMNEVTEVVAETSEELMEKYFSEEAFTADEIKTGLRDAVSKREVFPLIAGSALKNIGISALMDLIIDYMPCPVSSVAGRNMQGSPVTRKQDDAFSARVFKCIVDPFVGTINLFKIYSGFVKTGQDVYIPNSDLTLKVPQLFTMMGKTQIQLDAAYAGDIIAVAKMPGLGIGFTIADKKNPIIYDVPEYPAPTIYIAVIPKKKQDEEKISSALQKILQEDKTFETKRNPETSQLLIGGQGMTHIGYIIDKLKNTYKVEVDIEDPKVVYRETIRAKTDQHGCQGRHKKQTGGAGQFGDVWIRFEPTEKDFEFHEEVFGGAVPKNYFPAVEKGLQKALEKGPLAGFPVIGVKATLTDGSYHPVDSNEISFVLAAGLAWQEACKIIKPTILEPINEIKVYVKGEYVGAVMGDMSKRRGRILGQEDIEDGKTVITAEVPESEILKYTTELKAMTQASGRFTRKFIRYDIAPDDRIKKIIEEYKK